MPAPAPDLRARCAEFPALAAWIADTIALCEPADVVYCDGSSEQAERLTAHAIKAGILLPLNPETLPGCQLHRSAPNDVARVEQLTFICTPTSDEAGPTNHWSEPTAMREKLRGLLAGAMRGRTMYAVPYLMGPAGSPLSKVGVELTDSVYVALNMRLMSRVGSVALDALQTAPADFNRGLHSTLDLDPERRFIAHFPQDNEILSVGSGYGGNVLLGKKCFSLRIGSYLARQEGWMAEHMLLLSAESPTGAKHYIAAAFPSACGKTNFSMLIPPARFAGWTIRTVGDDIAWMKPGADGRLWAVNPEAGYFGVVPGTNWHTNPNAMATMARDTIYTNVALLDDGDVWWEGKDGPPPAACTDWKGERWTRESPGKAAHANSRFTSPMANNPALAPDADDPRGVPISAIIFGGRRANTVPLVWQSFGWTHGVFIGASMASETTAAATGAIGQVRRDPMAMLPFCGYHMGDYFQHWLDMGRQIANPPLIFGVNWFRRDSAGEFLWPGFGENMRVLRWIIERCEGAGSAVKSPVGWLPHRDGFDLDDLEGVDNRRFDALVRVDRAEWERELEAQGELFDGLGERLPAELRQEREDLRQRLATPPEPSGAPV